jgi:hypothetical protein
MHAFPSTSHNVQQSRGQGDPLRRRQLSVDLATAEWFCRNVCERAEAAAKAADIKDGFLVLSSFGELPVAGGDGDWEQIAPCNKSFGLGQHQAMAEQAAAWAEEPGRNVYLPMVLYPGGFGGSQRGKASDALGIFGLGADLDGDKGCKIRIENLPLRPTCVIRSSRDPADNFNLLWLFDRLISLNKARPIAKALAAVVGDADGGTADPTHVWRVAGTLNWPKKSKVARGRPLIPQLVRVDRGEALP